MGCGKRCVISMRHVHLALLLDGQARTFELTRRNEAVAVAVDRFHEWLELGQVAAVSMAHAHAPAAGVRRPCLLVRLVQVLLAGWIAWSRLEEASIRPGCRELRRLRWHPCGLLLRHLRRRLLGSGRVEGLGQAEPVEAAKLLLLGG